LHKLAATALSISKLSPEGQYFFNGNRNQQKLNIFPQQRLSFIFAQTNSQMIKSETGNKSDVWLTVHRNSAWIRKTN
jgi:hypothetical protein